VRLRGRGESNADQTELAADLVVDASGRGSRAAGWLAGLGFTPPRETTVDALTGYASRVYRVPAGHGDAQKAAYIKPTPPTGTRGGMIVPIEGDRWHVSLVGMDGDYPPTDEAGFLEFARSLPAPHLYQAIKEAEPLTNVSGYRRNQTRMLHYEDLPRYLESFLVSGDAVHSLNPVYALGVTAAAVGAVALENSLKAQRRAADADLAGLARRFQAELARKMAPMWSMATHEDRRWPATQSAGDLGPAPGWTPKAAIL
jgi:2-polyprenyl-6-methoxyphenol hydroxylase-like FAD-dependent oxidoreductase